MQLISKISPLLVACFFGSVLVFAEPPIGLIEKAVALPGSFEASLQDTSKEQIELSAQILFKQAKRGFQNKKYWESTVDLIVILEYYPDFLQIEEAVYLLGNGLYEMEMYHAADQMYRHLLESYPKTSLFPQVALALQKTHYQQREYQKSLEFYNALESHYPGNGEIGESRYYASQAHYHMKNYTLVPNITRLIKKKSPFYAFARYTEALVHLKKKNVRGALELFLELKDRSAKSREEADIIDASRLTLAYIYFELSNYKKAIEFLVRIDAGFYDYPEVLLTMGWCAYKLQDYRVAIDALSSLITDYPNDHLSEEGHFVLGQCYLRLGYYNFAIKEFDSITESNSSLNNFSDYGDQAILDIANQEKQVEKLKTQLLILETKLLQNLSVFGTNGSPEFIAKERKRMRELQQKLIEQIIEERKIFAGVTKQFADLKRRIQKAEVQKKWLSYADYGKARALYLRGVGNN